MRLSSILAHVLATSALLTCGACGGDATGASGGPGGGSDASTCEPTRAAGSGGCSDVWIHSCGLPPSVDPSDGMTREECHAVCGADADHNSSCELDNGPVAPGSIAFRCDTCMEGRRPAGYVDAQSIPTVAGWLAHAADLERVSIDAFQILARELDAHGAPATLVRRANAAEADEVSHARALGALATRAGARLEGAAVTHGPVRDLVDVAIENAVEGCVRETYGALVAGHQAANAMRLDVRRAMTAIYADETRHAELAWDVHAWLLTKLSAGEREQVEAAMNRAIAELATGAEAQVPPRLIVDLGLPSPSRALRMVAGLTTHLFAAAHAA